MAVVSPARRVVSPNNEYGRAEGMGRCLFAIAKKTISEKSCMAD